MCSFIARGQNEPVKVAIPHFYPPYIMQGDKKHFVGFDINMLNFICKYLKRVCQYKIIDFDQAINAVASHQVDMAIGAITITIERAQIVNFSIPYLPTQAQFLGRADRADHLFSLEKLNNSRIGIEQGSVFVNEIEKLGVENPIIIFYKDKDIMLDALSRNKIDYILTDEPTAQYWQDNSSGDIHVFGKPFNYGHGLGIAVNKDEMRLLQQINKALTSYQKSGRFIRDYNLYINAF